MGRKTGAGPLVVEPAQRLALLEIKHGFGRLAPSAADLLWTAANIADTTGFPIDASANERLTRLFLRRAASQLLAPLQQTASKAEREHDRILWQEPSQEQHDARAIAERHLYDARNRVYVARQQADQLVEDVLDTLLPLLSGVTLADLPSLLRLAAEDAA
ncbi:hypothetical protein ABTX80_24835 [Streptomyces erythrochromogenes]|uniref:hypothetical protein n=1 Tax=Streptomyces erythrochromogenes TaxID=285574 RepID=UPI00332D0F14